MEKNVLLMKKQSAIETVSSWYKTEGFYKDLVSFGFETIKPFLKGKTLLEIGPADGAMTKLLAPRFSHISLIEPSEKYAKLLRKEFPGATIHRTFLEQFSPTQTYDTIIMAHVLEHVDQPVTALKKLTISMNASSRLIIIVPNAQSLHRHLGVAMGLLKTVYSLNAYDKKLGHKRVYDHTQLHNDIHSAGLRCIRDGGIMMKLLSNAQMESWNPRIIRGLFSIGKTFPDICAELYAVCRKDD
jgi:2-polyprenyl-3-methyl-5-hydroxy-6-metoxy-1,4-benzoquinol methylase